MSIFAVPAASAAEAQWAMPCMLLPFAPGNMPQQMTYSLSVKSAHSARYDSSMA